jgi:hypothetical protein
MKLTHRFEKGIFFRLLISVLLAGAAVTLFFLSRPVLVKPLDESKQELVTLLQEIDREVDTVLVRFKIEKNWIRKRQIPLTNSGIFRIERQVAILKDVIPVQINVALNTMARRYQGRAIASENLKENSVTIHIEVQGYIVQTVILKHMNQLQRTIKKDKRVRA